MAEHVPHLVRTPPITMTTGATAVTGGNVVEISAGMTVIPAAADSVKVAGVVGNDGITGALVQVYTDGVHDLIAAGAIAAGDKVVAGAVAGTVATVAAAAGTAQSVTDTRAVIGVALEAIADTAKGRVLLTL